jgi:PKD repeat protein
VKRFRFIDLVVGISLMFMSGSVFAQNWPYPANTPGVEVACANCPGTQKGKLTAAYRDPISGFTGRWIDSTEVIDFQGGFRTGRAYKAAYSPQKDRIYMQIGSGIGVYSRSTFFSRIEGREPLTPISQFPFLSRLESLHAANPEIVLRWDQFFYAESSFSNWRTVVIDGQDRISGFSIDDRGWLYLANSVFGWGMLKDTGAVDGSIMQGKQFFPAGTTNEIDSSTAILVVKTSSGKYYALVEGGAAAGVKLQNVYDATDPLNAVRLFPEFSQTYSSAAPTADRTALIADGKILIYNNDAFVSNGAPLQTILPAAGGRFGNVDTDGTNFYVTFTDSNFQIYLEKLTPDATKSSYSGSPVRLPVMGVAGNSVQADAASMRYGDGYIAVVVNNFEIGFDLMLFRVDGTNFTEIPTYHYFNDYYTAVNGYKPDTSNYISCAKCHIYDALPMKNGSSLNLILSAYDLGDVYKIRTDDDIAVAAQGTSGTANPNAPARPAGTFFYGDRVRFLASTSSQTPKSVSWNFGNPEAAPGADPNTQAGGSTGLPVDHQYSGITPATLGGPRVVSATSGATVGQTTVTLTSGAARVGVSNGTTSFTFITDAASAGRAPIVAGDSFFDGSDGEIEGHYAEWTVDSTTSSKVPYSANGAHLTPVGACGAHTLTYAAHYGPYTNFLTAGGADFRVALSALPYTVQPVAAAINPVFTTDVSGNLVFSSVSRVSLDTTSLPASQAGSLTWHWDLVDSAAPETVALAGPTGTGNIASITPWTVPKTAFNAIGIRVRLMISTSALTGACAGKETSKAFTKALNGPDPQITGGCTNGGPPCNFTVSSVSGVNTTADNWHYAWSATGPAAVSPGLDQNTYAPVFTQTGTYTVTVTVTNAIGSKPVSTPVVITVVSHCPTMTSDNLYPTYRNQAFTCTISSNAGCGTGQPLSFFPQGSGYDLSCTTHTFDWDFGDGSAHVNTQEASHTYLTSGTFTITMKVHNAQQDYTATASIIIGGIIQTPTPPNPPPGKCPTMTSLNLYPTYRGTSATCNSANQQTCQANETVSFFVQPNSYDLGCDTHTFSWNFGDGSPVSNVQNPTHVYTTPGPRSVTLVVSNTSQFNYTSTIPITISGGGGPCPTMTTDNLYPVYRNPSLTCSISNNFGCVSGESLSFSPQTAGYDLNCSTHTYDWDFGDGTPHSTDQNPAHTYSAGGTFTIKLKVHNSQQDFTSTGIITVKDGTPVTPTFTAAFTAVAPDSSNPGLYAFTGSVTSGTPNITKVTWDFGDGTQLTKSLLGQVLNVYAKSGTYTVTMKVEASNSSPVIVSHQVTVVLTPSKHRGARH